MADYGDSRLPKRFWDKVSIQDTGCWLWRGSLHESGYGQFRWSGQTRRAHRVAYQELLSTISDEMVIDHICRNRGCVNPSHLRQVTHSENCTGTQDYSKRGVPKKYPRGLSARESLLVRVSKDNVSGCWLWMGSKTEAGYGRINNKVAHVLSYVEFVGPVRTGMVIDHLCNNRGCVNPDHLEQVTRKVNALRAIGNKDMCKKGLHEWSDSNIGIRSGTGAKYCLPCHSDWFVKKKRGKKNY